jgi:hypothetical protein
LSKHLFPTSQLCFASYFPHPIHVAQIDRSIRFWSAVVRRRFGSLLGFTDFRGKRTVGSRSYHRHRIEVDCQSGSKQPHSKGSADLWSTGFPMGDDLHRQAVADEGYED